MTGMSRCTIAFIAMLWYVCPGLNAQTQISTQEKQALLDIYNTMNGPNWVAGGFGVKPWDISKDPSTWSGVTIKDGTVTDLDLHARKLTGKIPASVGNLTNLQTLNLSSNSISGELPEALFRLKKLRILAIALQRAGEKGETPTLSCRLPESLYMPELEKLLLQDNALQGPLPRQITLPKVEVVHLGGNRFTGGIPEVWTKLPMLRVLALLNNSLEGDIPQDYSAMPNLIALYVGNNAGLTGTFPKSLTKCTKLQELELQKTQISGSIPEDIGNLTQLTKLYCSNMNLTGRIPESIGNCKALKGIYLGANRLCGPLPDSFGKLTPTSLELSLNPIGGTIPEWLCRMRSLRELRMSSMKLTGTIPEKLAPRSDDLGGDDGFGLGNLFSLDLSFNELSGELPARFGGMKKLTSLFLCGNKLSGEPMKLLLQLEKIRNLDIHANSFSGTLNSILDGRLSDLGTIDLSENHFTGPIVSLDYSESGTPFTLFYSRGINISKNDFTFIDFQNLANALKNQEVSNKIIYAPQNAYGQESTKEIKTGEAVTLTAALPDPRKKPFDKEDKSVEPNVYAWKLGDRFIPGETEATYKIASASAGDAGIYTCTATNRIAPALSLISKPMILTFPEGLVSIDDQNPSLRQERARLVYCGATEMKLYDVQGTLIRRTNGEAVGIENLPAGIYIVCVHIGDKILAVKYVHR